MQNHPKPAHILDAPEQGVEREPNRKVEDDTHHGGGDGRQHRRKRFVAQQRFDVGRAQEDPQK